jgi:hypothetical protein
VTGEVTRNLKQAQLDSETWHSKLDLLGCDSETECKCPSIRDMRDMRHTQEPSVNEGQLGLDCDATDPPDGVTVRPASPPGFLAAWVIHVDHARIGYEYGPHHPTSQLVQWRR